MISSSPDGVFSGAGRDHSAPLARLLVLLESARPADIPAVASRLPETGIATAIEAVQGRIAWPLREYILTDGPSTLLIALARQAVLGRGEWPENAVDRVLMRFDPDADAAFFDLDPGIGQVLRARRVILRERKGPDGHAVIPPTVKQALLDAVAAGEPGQRLMREIAAADDPDLVLALVPYAGKLRGLEAASIITTLEAHGLRSEARRHRKLWAGRGRQFSVLGFPRFGDLSRSFPLDTGFSPAEAGLPLTLDRYLMLVKQVRRPVFDHSRSARVAAWTALRAGTLTAAEILEHTRPAALTLSLAAAPADHALRPGERRAADDVRALIARHAAEQLTDDPKGWVHAITRVNGYQGTLMELLTDPDSAPDHGYLINNSTYMGTDVDAANVLLALAPADLADRIVAAKGMKQAIDGMINETPLCRALVEHVVTRGDIAEREGLAINEATPDSVLVRLLGRKGKADVAFAIMDRDQVGPDVLEHAWAAAPRGRKLKKSIVQHARYDAARAMHALRCLTQDAEFFISVLREAIDEFDEPEEMAAYMLLAEVAGVEAVWALDLDREGSLDVMDPHVRASMATGDAEPLLAAARAMAVDEGTAESLADRASDTSSEPAAFAWSRTEEELDHPLDRPLENLIRTHLDGRVDRWLELAELLRTKPDLSDEELIRGLPSGSR